MQIMDKSSIIKRIFPKLATDKAFKITSPEDPNYNCIAWAYQLYKDRWMQPPSGMRVGLDGVSWWPDGVEEGTNINCLVQAFSEKGFMKCESPEHEVGFLKVALYYKPDTNEWTHAARESKTGDFWMSKLGSSFDIHHGSPYTIENNSYGKVYCIMKRIFN